MLHRTCPTDSYVTTAGKSTLLQILAGKRLIKGADVRIRDRDVFRDSPPGVAFLGTEWSVPPWHSRYILTLLAFIID